MASRKIAKKGKGVVARRVTAKKEKRGAAKRKSGKKSVSTSTLSVEELILSHRENGRKLARSILRKWRVRMPTSEIDSIVDLALCEAANRYKADVGASFMTFMFYHLRGHLVRYVVKASRASNLFLNLARAVGVDTSDWLSEEEGSGVISPDYLETTYVDVDSPEQLVLRKERIERCRSAVLRLDVLEQEVLRRSFAKEEPLVHVARELGYSRCHISRVKKSAMVQVMEVLSERCRHSEGHSTNCAGGRVAAKSGLKTRSAGRRRKLQRLGIGDCAKAA